MSLIASWLICGIGITLVGIFTVREVQMYRRDQQSRTEIYPYTRKRLIGRFFISLFLVGEALLLLPGHHTLSRGRPIWSAVYVLLVGFFAIAMAIIALLDLRESRKLHRVSQRRLFEEFVHELKQGKEPPAQH